MSGPRNNPEQDLTSTLQQRADDFARLGGHDLDLSQVVSRAGEIRRGRRMRATMVMAAVTLAIAVPVGISVLDNGADNISPTPSPTSSVDPTATPSTAVVPNPDPVGLNGLDDGPATGLVYVADHELHYGATTVPVPGGEIAAVARIAGGFLVGQYDDTGETARFIPDDGSDANTWPMNDGSGFAVNREGSVGAFVRPDGQVVAVQDGGSRWFEVGTPLPAQLGYSVEAIQADSCTDRSETNVCTVWLTGAGEKPQVWSVSPHRAPKAVLDGWLRLNDLSTTGDRPLLAGQISTSDQGSCSEVLQLRADTQKVLWKTCANSLEAFSPDGRHLLAGPAYRDGPGDGIIAVLDAQTGATLATIKADAQSVFSQYVWEDDSHLLAVVQDLSGQGRAGLVRIGLDGSRELVAPVVGLSGGGLGYRLPRR